MPTGIVVSAKGLGSMTGSMLDAIEQTTSNHRVFLYENTPAEELTKAWNHGVITADYFGCDTVVIMNNDCFPSHGWLPPLLARLDDFAAIGPVTDNPGHQPKQEGVPREVPCYQTIEWTDGVVGQGKALNGFCFASTTERFLAIPFDEERWTFLGSEDYWMYKAWNRWSMPFGIARHSYVRHLKAATRKAKQNG